MKRLGMMVMATVLGLGAAGYVSAEDPADTTKADSSHAVVTAETRGDLARLHNNYDTAISYYMAALRATPNSPDLYNKMGITELTISVLPWLLTMLVFLAMVTYIPALSLWLPHLLGML